MLVPTLAALILLTAPASQDDDRTVAMAQAALDRGAELFDARDAEAMAATFIDDAQLILFKRDSESGRYSTESRGGRSEIREAYAELFKDRDPDHRARNTVETARMLTPDLLLIEGRFALDRNQGDIVQFVQVRARGDGDRWQVVTMQIMPLD